MRVDAAWLGWLGGWASGGLSASCVAAICLIAAGCACGPQPLDAGLDVPRDAPPPQDCAEYPDVHIDPFPTIPPSLSIPEVHGSGVHSPLLVGDELFVSTGIVRGAGPLAQRNEGVVRYSSEGMEVLVWEEWAFGAEVQRSLVVSQPYAVGLRVAELARPGAWLWQVDLLSRFPRASVNTLGNFHVLGPQEDVALLRYSRHEGDIDAATLFTFYRAHLWSRDGTELTPPDGVAIDENIQIIATAPAFDSVSASAAGELFYAAERPPMDTDGPWAMRVVRRAADMSLAMVSEPIVDPDANPPDVSRYLSGLWGAATADGAYVAYAIARPAVGLPPVSHFVRVERDGSIGWHHTTAGYASHGDLPSRSVAEVDGGMIALVRDLSLAHDLRFYVVLADGTRPLGEDGRSIADAVGYGDELRESFLGIAPDGEGGAFIDAAWGEPSFAAHLDAASTPIWVTRSYLGGLGQGLFPDGDGGVWIVGYGEGVQHFDALGRPLYARRFASCIGGGLRLTTLIYDYTDGGVVLDAGVEPSLDAAAPDAGDLDAGVDAGIDADLDAG